MVALPGSGWFGPPGPGWPLEDAFNMPFQDALEDAVTAAEVLR
jgi:hypothetical protein